MLGNNTLENFDGIAEAPAIATKKAATDSLAAGTTRKSHRFWGSARMTYTICAFMSMCLHICMRSTLNFVVLCMVNSTTQATHTHTYAQQARESYVIADADAFDGESVLQPKWKCDLTMVQNASNSLASSAIERTGELQWTRTQEISLLGTFFYGYVITLPFAGRLADTFGGKLLFVHSITLQALVYMLLPLCARLSYVAAVVARVVQGLIAGCSNPAIYQLFLTWAHPTERTALLTIAYAGFSIGSFVTFPLSSVFCRIGWVYAFYTIGGISLLFGICCHWLVYNTLDEHPRLSREEHEYLKVVGVASTKKTTLPWRAILTSMPIYAFVLTHIFHTYGVTVIALMMPRFLKEAMGYSLLEAGIYASAPFLGGVLGKGAIIYGSRVIEQRKGVNLTVCRRIVYVLCNIATISLLLGMIFFDCNQRNIVVVFLLFVGAFSDIAFSGAYWPSLLFVAPSYAGLLIGVANCLATCSGFIAPIIISHIVKEGTEHEWDYALLTMILSYGAGMFVYGLWGSSKLQRWDQSSSSSSTNQV